MTDDARPGKAVNPIIVFAQNHATLVKFIRVKKSHIESFIGKQVSKSAHGTQMRLNISWNSAILKKGISAFQRYQSVSW